MIQIGEPPYLECSSIGDRRFSAYYARLKCCNNRSIEEVYQASKVFKNGKSNLSIKEAKGKKAVNMDFCTKVYKYAWRKYFEENPELLEYACKFNGFTDRFGKRGCNCQAIEIYNIVQEVKLLK